MVAPVLVFAFRFITNGDVKGSVAIRLTLETLEFVLNSSDFVEHCCYLQLIT